MPPAPGFDELPIEPSGTAFDTVAPDLDVSPFEAAAVDVGIGNGSSPGSATASTTDAFSVSDAIPPAPPSPSEIAGFSEGLADASELVEPVSETKGSGILARYLKGDD